MKTALVTGGSRGIGRAICQKLAQMGYHVLINYVSNEAAAQETLAAIGGQGELIRFDVGDPEAVRTAVEGWQAAHPEEYIEVLVNNAGIRKKDATCYVHPRTPVPGLFLTGQNCGLHGILGVSETALVTCREILGETTLNQILQR